MTGRRSAGAGELTAVFCHFLCIARWYLTPIQCPISPCCDSPEKKKRFRKKRSARKKPAERNVPSPETIEEESKNEDSPGLSVSSDMSIRTEYVKAKKSVADAPKIPDSIAEEEEEKATSPPAISDEEATPDEILSTASKDYDNELEIRKMHAALIADAREKFPTREALEDAIRERQREVEAACQSGFSIDKETLARAAVADDEVRKLLPLRLILPTTRDLTEMIGVLQIHKEAALRGLNIAKAEGIESEINELRNQIEEEERYVLKKAINLKKVPTPKTLVGILKSKKDRTVKTEYKVETVESESDEGDQ